MNVSTKSIFILKCKRYSETTCSSYTQGCITYNTKKIQKLKTPTTYTRKNN